MNQISSFEQQYSELLVEYILYLRDRNPKKDWGHLRGNSTVFSYCRWNKKVFPLLLPKDLVTMKSFFHIRIEPSLSVFEEKEIDFIKKYKLLDEGIFTAQLESNDKETFPFIYMLLEWYRGDFEKKYLEKYSYTDSFLYNFLLAVSSLEHHEHDYYFRFSEMIKPSDISHLILSFKQNPGFLFTSIALASYYFNKKNHKVAYNFYKQALIQDPDNPWITGRQAILYLSIGGKGYLLKAKNSMEEVRKNLPNAPWVYTYSAEVANALGEYGETLAYVEKYEEITQNGYRTFEPYMRRADAYMNLGELFKARKDLGKINDYYFGEGYRFLYNQFDETLKNIGY